MRSILIHADRGPATTARLETGLSIARMTGGHVTVLVDTPIQRYIAMDPLGGSYLASEALSQALVEDQEQASNIAGQLAGQDVPFDVVHSSEETLDAMASASRLADLVVVSRGGRLAGELAIAARTPVLVLADEALLPLPLNKAMIAWDGGDEAALALRSATALLAGCPSVTVVTVKEKPGGFPATDAMSYLSRHGIKAELREVARSGSTEQTLMDEVERCGPDLLVMGAYGKSRMREYMFGGVTRLFLEKSPKPALLLAH